MSIFRGASTFALLAHEMRLAWRSTTKTKDGKPDNRGRRRAIGFFIALAALAGTLGIPFAIALDHFAVKLTPEIALGVDAGIVLLLTLMLSQTVSASAQNFYERGDLDLLLSSPMPPQRVLTVRCLGMALNVAIYTLLLVSPVILPAVIMGHIKWLTVYPVVAAISLFATALGLAVATSLFKLIGARRAKTLAQVMSAIIGACVFLVSQARNALGDRITPYWNKLMAFAHSGPFASDQPASWPGHAVMGEPKPAFIMFGVSALIFLVVVRWLGRRFAQDAAAAAGVGVNRPKAAKGRVRGFNGGPFQAMLRKEMRLLRRDPALLSQVLLRALYILPLVLIPWTGGHGIHSYHGIQGTDAIALRGGAFLVLMSSQLAGTLAWITVSAEDAPEMLATAPVAASLMRRAKLCAAMMPVVAILALPLGALSYMSPWAGAVSAVGCIAASLSACLIAVWYEKPARRSDLRRRRSGSLVSALAEFFVGAAWAAAAGLAILQMPWAAIPAVVAVVILIAIRKPERSFAETLQAA